MITHQKLEEASRRLRGAIYRTPLLHSRLLNKQMKAEIFLKAENFQRTGSFKFRGAYNAISCLDPIERSQGVVTYSSGNHAQAVARVAQIFNIPAVVVMPNDAPPSKKSATESYGAEVITYERQFIQREDIATKISIDRNMTVIPPFNDENVIAGQSTCAQEIFEDTGPLDILLVCVGGGGLISGSALAKRKLSPNCQIIGVEPFTGNDVQLSLEQGKIVTIEVPNTIADGQQTTAPGEKTFEIINDLVHSIVTVTDNEIVTAMDYLFRFQKLVIEPSGASAMAALLSNKIDCAGKKIGLTLSGGNIDPARFSNLMSTHTLLRL